MESKQQITDANSNELVPANEKAPAPVELELVHLFDKIASVRAFVLDVDGVLTNNDLLVMENGDLLRTMSVRDGQAIKWAIQAGYPVAIITGGKSPGVRKRLTGLGIEEYYSDVLDKWEALQAFMSRTNTLVSEICYMGDDLPDLPVLRKVVLSSCPNDATVEVRDICDYVSPVKGGHGCVRDIIEKVLKVQEKWPEY
ncbi:MAG: HAD-IIIA family hydrolase [Lewinellaceae bacterium]|nr:HAD-IIIA family hydrolase [Saprospiraceae bacterium]MCB0544617.1 HAD-IIIA family hydrolase [Saprospiraceae bacterium]MCB9307979.1 HAD-IIIA family hydrolase [Lewinellaceae bacterium]MCB9355671.1 HAD-IIIA family hydrolase [Lewinellaceae bacterium]